VRVASALDSVFNSHKQAETPQPTQSPERLGNQPKGWTCDHKARYV